MNALRRLSFLACLLLSLYTLAGAEPARSVSIGGPVGACTCPKKLDKCVEHCASVCSDCIAVFTCNTADPCLSSCRCKVINP